MKSLLKKIRKATKKAEKKAKKARSENITIHGRSVHVKYTSDLPKSMKKRYRILIR